jgi:2-oxoisovalerate dehydrogenase E2 component (dihydrolipoyl transacylase)
MGDFKLPDLGEGLTEGEILQWFVKVGDTVTLNQPIVEVETAKAAVEVPSPFAGVVTKIHHEAGETVDVGRVIISFDTGSGEAPAGDPGNPEEATAAAFAPEEGALIGEVGPGGRTATLVGYGPKSGPAARRPRKDAAAAAAPAEPPPARVSAAAVGQAAARQADVTVLAKPPVRKLAKELGVELATVGGSGQGGVITRADVEAAASSAQRPELSVVFDDQREHRIPVKGVRKVMAQAMSQSAFTAPHVTEFLTFDMTASMELLPRLKAMPELREVKISPLLLVAKAVLLAVRRNPEINSTFTDAEIVVKDYVNLGIAAATPRGLVVPNIKGADRMSLPELAHSLQDLVEVARAGKTAPTDMQGGTITITNVGVFGVDTGTPIINPGESAILAFGAVRPMPWVVDDQVVPRQVTTLALSFDHRHIDGQLGSRFLADVGRVLSDPATAFAWS